MLNSIGAGHGDANERRGPCPPQECPPNYTGEVASPSFDEIRKSAQELLQREQCACDKTEQNETLILMLKYKAALERIADLKNKTEYRDKARLYECVADERDCRGDGWVKMSFEFKRGIDCAAKIADEALSG